MIMRGRTPLRARRQKKPRHCCQADDPDDRANQRPYDSHGKARAPKAPAKGGHGIEITNVDKDDSDDDKIMSVGATKPALLRASAAAAVRGEVSTRRGDGGVGMCPDDNITAAARFALGVKGRMPDDEARAALESLPGTEVVRRALAALRKDTNEEEEQDNDNEEEQGIDDGEDGFVITQNDNTKMRPCTSPLSSGGLGEQRRQCRH